LDVGQGFVQVVGGGDVSGNDELVFDQLRALP
jgi:hypothetical protein